MNMFVLEPQQFIHIVWRDTCSGPAWLRSWSAADINSSTNLTLLSWRHKPHCPSWAVREEKVFPPFSLLPCSCFHDASSCLYASTS